MKPLALLPLLLGFLLLAACSASEDADFTSTPTGQGVPTKKDGAKLQVMGEVGFIDLDLDHNDKTIQFSRTYTSPVVFIKSVSYEGRTWPRSS